MLNKTCRCRMIIVATLLPKTSIHRIAVLLRCQLLWNLLKGSVNVCGHHCSWHIGLPRCPLFYQCKTTCFMSDMLLAHKDQSCNCSCLDSRFLLWSQSDCIDAVGSTELFSSIRSYCTKWAINPRIFLSTSSWLLIDRRTNRTRKWKETTFHFSFSK